MNVSTSKLIKNVRCIFTIGIILFEYFHNIAVLATCIQQYFGSFKFVIKYYKRAVSK